MKAKLTTRMIFLLILIGLIFPSAGLAEGGDEPDNPQIPISAEAMQLGATIQLEGGVPDEPPVDDQANNPLPEALLSRDIVAEQMAQVQTEGRVSEGIILDGEDPNSLRAPDTCYEYVQNGGFEANANWSASPQSNVSYITQYYYQGVRSLHMTTQNWQNPWLWQRIGWQLLNPLGSLSTWFRYAAYLDPGERAYVLIYDETFTQLLTYAEIPATAGGWNPFSVYFPQNGLAGRTVYLAFYIAQDNDGYHSNLYLDNVQLLGCDTPPPAQTSIKRTIDLNISLHYTPNATQQGYYRNIIRYASEAIFEMSNGVHAIGRVRFYQNKEYQQLAHIIWSASGSRAGATSNGYYDPAKGKINFSDADSYGRSYIVNDPTRQRTAGYVIAHELGHYYYGLLDEYQEKVTTISNNCASFGYYLHMPHCDDQPVPNSVMHDQYNGLTDLDWLNFSVAKNQTFRNAQYRIHNASGWETLISPYSTNNANAYYQISRRYYSELAAVAPVGNADPSIQLPGGSSTADDYLDIQFVPPSTLQAPDVTYSASVSSLHGDQIAFPQPVVLAASVNGDGLIARTTLSTQVTAPNGTTSALTLKDDGIAPDEFANDGRYSGILPYNQNGTYTIQATFTNPNNQAAYTTIGLLDGPWQLGAAVGAGFTAVGSTTVTISGYTSDDHSNLFTGATLLPSDNVAKHGQINGAGDKDMFKGTLISKGTYVFRLTNLAQNIRPRIRIWSADGQSLLGDFTIDPDPGYYYFIYITGAAGASFIAELSHTNPQAVDGLYDVSFGLPMTGEASTGSIIFLPHSRNR